MNKINKKINNKIILIFKKTIKDEINRTILKEKYQKNKIIYLIEFSIKDIIDLTLKL